MSGLDVRAFTVGPVQENCYIVRAGGTGQAASDAGTQAGGDAGTQAGGDAGTQAGGSRAGTQAGGGEPAIIVDPGDEPERLLAAAGALGVQLRAILVTHCHFDHIGAVAPVASATGAPVYCPQIESPVLADIMRWVPPGFGPFQSYEADHTLAGGERLSLAGLDIEVLYTPGHSPGHVTYAISRPDGEVALFSGDVLFAGSVGRVDLPGGDWATLERSIGTLLRTFSDQTAVYPGHMGITTLGRERATNPFLDGLRSAGHAMAEAQASSPQR